MDASTLLKGTRARWLVTGAAGFIGSHLLETLALAGQAVVGVDNFVTGKRENIEAVGTVLARRGIDLKFVEGDVCDPVIAGKLTRSVDYVLHQAAIGSLQRSIDDPLNSFVSNVDGFVRMLEAARLEKVKAFVYASSSSVYGDHAGLPKREGKTGRPLSPSAATKAADELLAAVYSRCYGIRTIGLRYFNVFGPRQDTDGPHAAVIPRWIAAMLRGERIYINGDGMSSRDFCFVDNVVQANIRAALCAPPDVHGTLLNIAVGEQVTLLGLFGILKDLLQEYRSFVVDMEPTFREFRSGDIRHSLASIEKARRLIGYAPTHTLEQGLRVALGWYVAKDPLGAPRQDSVRL
jgi:UDP-N-acetylglucosamine 4-epimerase